MRDLREREAVGFHLPFLLDMAATMTHGQLDDSLSKMMQKRAQQHNPLWIVMRRRPEHLFPS
jgi:hypothetical protein